MAELLDDRLNLDILENLCRGIGVEVNISDLASTLKKHRNTIRTHVDGLLEKKIILRPIYPFLQLYTEYPLLVVARADLPRSAAIERFLQEDEQIFSAYYVRDEEFNTLMIEFHKDLYAYSLWRGKIVAERKIPPRETRYPADSATIDMRNLIKYQPNSAMHVIEERYRSGEKVAFDGYELEDLSFNILKRLTMGEGIRTNENQLSKDLGVHRKTVERRIAAMLDAKIVGPPVCRFPHLFVAPNQILVYYLVEIKRAKSKVFQAIIQDPCISMAVEISTRRYNLLLFGVFFSVEEHFQWEERYDTRFPNSIGAMKKIYLTPSMSAPIDQQKVSLSIIQHKKEVLYGRELMQTIVSQKK